MERTREELIAERDNLIECVARMDSDAPAHHAEIRDLNKAIAAATPAAA